MHINILQYLAETSVTKPDKTAVVDSEKRYSISDVTIRSKKIGQFIAKRTGEKIRRPIAVFLPKNFDCITGDLGIIYSGNAYMNLDIKNPKQRLENILSLVEPELVLTDTQHADLIAPMVAEEKIIRLDEIDFDAIQIDENYLAAILDQIIDTDPLCLINTSGSTGTPKSVILNHRSFIDFTEWANRTLKIHEDEIIGCLSPVVFDIYSFELCMLMSKSATMVIIPESFAAFPVQILNLMVKEKINFIFWVPTIMVNIANGNLLQRIPLPDLRTVWFAGEVFPTKQFNYWRKENPNTKFVNLYGPIEITLDCTYFIVDREIPDHEPIPIGFPCRNTDVLILNDENKPVSGTEEGELCVRGSSLALGYYNNPEKTSAAFVQNPLNNSYPETIYRTGDVVFRNKLGEIIFKGRKDSLIKHSGYRIELGEIEHVIVNTLKLAKNGCVVYHIEKKEITLVYEAEKDLDPRELRTEIAKILPKYMVPTKFIRMEQLPRNTNGKIDRLFLKEKVNRDE